MKIITTSCTCLSLLLCCASKTDADSFGTGGNIFDIEFVTIGNPDNDDDMTGDPTTAGKVEYAYRMGKFEISRDMITKANNEGGLGITLWDMSDWGGNGADIPATGVTWFEAATFVNWLNTSTGYTPAYKFNGGTFELWQSGDAGYDANNFFRNSQAYYFLPSMDEWYKAAYYDPNGVYYDYPTGSDTAPTAVASGTAADTAVYVQTVNQGPADITLAGGLSPYGTMGQGGNVWEFEETEWDLSNDSSLSDRGIRGGFWANFSTTFHASTRNEIHPSTGQSPAIGFRVASIPESGDFDDDGDVDGTDFLYWQLSDGSESSLNLWQASFGNVASSVTAASIGVPEPSTLFLSLLGLSAVGIRRRRFGK